LYGSPETRHDDYREIVIDVIACQPNKIDGLCLNTTQAQKEEMLNKIEVAVMYDTQMFDPFNKKDSVVSSSEIQTYPLTRSMKLEMDFVVTLGQVENE